MAKRPNNLLAIVVLTLGAGLVYLYFSHYHWFWYLSGRPGKLAGTSDKGIAGAPAKSPPGGAKKATLEDRWEVGRPINPPVSIDGPHLLSDPSFSPLMRALHLGDMELAKSLMAAGANVNAADRHGNTALIIAANRVEL